MRKQKPDFFPHLTESSWPRKVVVVVALPMKTRELKTKSARISHLSHKVQHVAHVTQRH